MVCVKDLHGIVLLLEQPQGHTDLGIGVQSQGKIGHALVEGLLIMLCSAVGTVVTGSVADQGPAAAIDVQLGEGSAHQVQEVVVHVLQRLGGIHVLDTQCIDQFLEGIPLGGLHTGDKFRQGGLFQSGLEFLGAAADHAGLHCIQQFRLPVAGQLCGGQDTNDHCVILVAAHIKDDVGFHAAGGGDGLSCGHDGIQGDRHVHLLADLAQFGEQRLHGIVLLDGNGQGTVGGVAGADTQGQPVLAVSLRHVHPPRSGGEVISCHSAVLGQGCKVGDLGQQVIGKRRNAVCLDAGQQGIAVCGADAVQQVPQVCHICLIDGVAADRQGRRLILVQGQAVQQVHSQGLHGRHLFQSQNALGPDGSHIVALGILGQGIEVVGNGAVSFLMIALEQEGRHIGGIASGSQFSLAADGTVDAAHSRQVSVHHDGPGIGSQVAGNGMAVQVQNGTVILNVQVAVQVAEQHHQACGSPVIQGRLQGSGIGVEPQFVHAGGLGIQDHRLIAAVQVVDLHADRQLQAGLALHDHALHTVAEAQVIQNLAQGVTQGQAVHIAGAGLVLRRAVGQQIPQNGSRLVIETQVQAVGIDLQALEGIDEGGGSNALVLNDGGDQVIDDLGYGSRINGTQVVQPGLTQSQQCGQDRLILPVGELDLHIQRTVFCGDVQIVGPHLIDGAVCLLQGIGAEAEVLQGHIQPHVPGIFCAATQLHGHGSQGAAQQAGILHVAAGTDAQHIALQVRFPDGAVLVHGIGNAVQARTGLQQGIDYSLQADLAAGEHGLVHQADVFQAGIQNGIAHRFSQGLLQLHPSGGQPQDQGQCAVRLLHRHKGSNEILLALAGEGQAVIIEVLVQLIDQVQDLLPLHIHTGPDNGGLAAVQFFGGEGVAGAVQLGTVQGVLVANTALSAFRQFHIGIVIRNRAVGNSSSVFIHDAPGVGLGSIEEIILCIAGDHRACLGQFAAAQQVMGLVQTGLGLHFGQQCIQAGSIGVGQRRRAVLPCGQGQAPLGRSNGVSVAGIHGQAQGDRHLVGGVHMQLRSQHRLGQRTSEGAQLAQVGRHAGGQVLQAGAVQVQRRIGLHHILQDSFQLCHDLVDLGDLVLILRSVILNESVEVRVIDENHQLAVQQVHLAVQRFVIPIIVVQLVCIGGLGLILVQVGQQIQALGSIVISLLHNGGHGILGFLAQILIVILHQRIDGVQPSVDGVQIALLVQQRLHGPHLTGGLPGQHIGQVQNVQSLLLGLAQGSPIQLQLIGDRHPVEAVGQVCRVYVALLGEGHSLSVLAAAHQLAAGRDPHQAAGVGPVGLGGDGVAGSGLGKGQQVIAVGGSPQADRTGRQSRAGEHLGHGRIIGGVVLGYQSADVVVLPGLVQFPGQLGIFHDPQHTALIGSAGLVDGVVIHQVGAFILRQGQLIAVRHGGGQAGSILKALAVSDGQGLGGVSNGVGGILVEFKAHQTQRSLPGVVFGIHAVGGPVIQCLLLQAVLPQGFPDLGTGGSTAEGQAHRACGQTFGRSAVQRIRVDDVGIHISRHHIAIHIAGHIGRGQSQCPSQGHIIVGAGLAFGQSIVVDGSGGGQGIQSQVVGLGHAGLEHALVVQQGPVILSRRLHILHQAADDLHGHVVLDFRCHTAGSDHALEEVILQLGMDGQNVRVSSLGIGLHRCAVAQQEGDLSGSAGIAVQGHLHIQALFVPVHLGQQVLSLGSGVKRDAAAVAQAVSVGDGIQDIPMVRQHFQAAVHIGALEHIQVIHALGDPIRRIEQVLLNGRVHLCRQGVSDRNGIGVTGIGKGPLTAGQGHLLHGLTVRHDPCSVPTGPAVALRIPIGFDGNGLGVSVHADKAVTVVLGRGLIGKGIAFQITGAEDRLLPLLQLSAVGIGDQGPGRCTLAVLRRMGSHSQSGLCEGQHHGQSQQHCHGTLAGLLPQLHIRFSPFKKIL